MNKTEKNHQKLLEHKNECARLLKHYHAQDYTAKATELEVLRIFEKELVPRLKKLSNHVDRAIMFPMDVSSWHRLPSKLEIYRGSREPEKRIGISWSLDVLIGESFACLATLLDARDASVGFDVEWQLPDGKKTIVHHFTEAEEDALPCVLFKGECSKADVLAYTNARHEQEIIINPKKVRNMREIEIRPETMLRAQEMRLKLRANEKIQGFIAAPLDELLARMRANETVSLG